MTKLCQTCKTVNPDPLQKTCSFACRNAYLLTPKGEKDVLRALKRVKQLRERKERQDSKLRKDKAKGIKHWMAVTQRLFNEFIKLRDKGKPCISCGCHEYELRGSHLGGVWDAGHYKTVGAHPELRFEPKNVNGQCRDCNGFKSGNIKGQDKGIVARFGQRRLDWLNGPHESKNYTIEELSEFRKELRTEINKLKS